MLEGSNVQRCALCPFDVLVGGTRQRRSAGTNFKPRKPLENAQTSTSRVYAVAGALFTS